MKTIGIIGGMSWESSAEYYRVINQKAKQRLGGLHSAKSLMFSFDFAEIEQLQHEGQWNEATRLMVEAAQNLQKGGAEFVIISTNTMHRMAKEVAESISIPLLHIADPTAAAIQKQGIKKIALLGTKYTMEQDFYKGRLIENYSLDVMIPNDQDRKIVNDVIYNELCLGVIKPKSKAEYLRIIQQLKNDGAEGVILGCTEIGMLVKPEDTNLPVFDTTRIHAETAVEFALQT